MMMDKDTVLPVGAGLRLCEVGGANQWKPGMSDAPGLGPGIISCQLQVERVPDLTWFMWGNMVIEATKPSVDRCWYELIGSCGFFGKGLLDCEKYIVKVIGTPEKLIEALPVDIMSNPTPTPTPTPNPNPNPSLTLTRWTSCRTTRPRASCCARASPTTSRWRKSPRATSSPSRARSGLGLG